ncbi:MAG: hypothetical protein OXC07_00740 [Kistimonas sp.]|nr:hypothetical protein [Kistimonas sp.]
MARMRSPWQAGSLLAWIFRRRKPRSAQKDRGSDIPGRTWKRVRAWTTGSRVVQDCQGQPRVHVSLKDRLAARLVGGSLTASLARRAGLCGRKRLFVGRPVSAAHALKLFYVDARENRGRFLAELLSDRPDVAEQMLLSLSEEERVEVLCLFGYPAPVLMPDAAGNGTTLLARTCQQHRIASTLARLLEHSGEVARGASLERLYDVGCLDFGILFELHRLFVSGLGKDPVASCLQQMRTRMDPQLVRYLETFQSLINRALPRYCAYWARCTGLPSSACPVRDMIAAGGLACLTPEVLDRLCQDDASGFDAETARLGWRKVQPRSSTTLRHSRAAMDDFLFRTFSARQSTAQEGLASF